MAGSGATGTISLSCPNDVILDADGYLYIVEYNAHRIVASGPHGFRCIIACTGSNGIASDQLYHCVNNRVQLFLQDPIASPERNNSGKP